MEKTHLLRSFAMVMAIASPAVASAQAGPAFAPRIVSGKTEAILGAPSRLAQILASQGERAPTTASFTLPSMAAQTIAPANVTYRPAIYQRPASTIFRNAVVSANRPDFFGTVALEVGRTPLDQKVAASRGSVDVHAAAYAAQFNGGDRKAAIEAINFYVNRRVRFVDDVVQYGVADRWQTASETLSKGRGDCEDYAIAKRELLRRAGFSDSDMYLTVVKDLVRRADHAVLVVRANGRFLVLDNGTDEVLDADEVNDYRPVLTYAAGRAWTHGYRRDVPSMQLASAAPATPTPVVPAAAPREIDASTL